MAENQELKLENGEKLMVPDHWKFIERSDNMAIVTDGKVKAKTPLKDHDISYKCSRCENYGPWDGVICRSCGQRSHE